MTLIKERAVQMIQHMPEESMFYVVNILENLQAMSISKEKAALKDILNMEKRLPDDFDDKKELAEARMERYGHFS